MKKTMLFSLLIVLSAVFSFAVQGQDEEDLFTRRSRSSSSQGIKSELPAQGADWVAGPGPEWEIHYAAALAKAAAEHKKVYVLSTGSDWCGWCIKLRNDVLTTPEFKEFARNNLVLLYLDSPMKKPLPPEQQKHNSVVRAMLNFSGGVPSAKVLDEKGRILAERPGYMPPDAYMDFLNKAVGAQSASPAQEEQAGDSWVFFHGAKFKLVSWRNGKSGPEQPLRFSEPIIVSKGTNVNVKLQYDIPGDTRYVVFLQSPDIAVSSSSSYARGRGELVYSLSSEVPRECSRFYLKIGVPGKGQEEELKIPCRIIWKDRTAEAPGLPGQEPDWVAGPGPEWEIHYDTALAKAAAGHKKVYVLNTGSDWCHWCIKLRNDVLTNREFRKFAKNNLILLYLDSPKRNMLPPSQQQHNTMVRNMLKFDGGVPSAKVLDEKGRIIAERSGYADLDAYMDFLKRAVRATAQGYAAAQERQLEDAKRAVRKAKFKIVAWGESKERVNRPFKSSTVIRVPTGTFVYFKFQYDLPKDMRSQIWLRSPGVSVSSPSGILQGRGESVQFLAYNTPTECKVLQFKMRMAGGKESLDAAEFPCRIIWE